MSRLREAVQAMPFLADRRVIVVSDAQTLRADPRRALFAAMERGSRGQHADRCSTCWRRAATKPQSLGGLAGRAAVRVDTTADEGRARVS